MYVPEGKKLDLYLVTMQTSTHSAERERVLQQAEALREDPKRTERLAKACKCPVCFYVHTGGMAGASITHRACAVCLEEQVYSSTATDLLCLKCAKDHKLCKKCGSDVELKDRRHRNTDGTLKTKEQK